MTGVISKRNSVKRRRDKLRAMGLRPVQIWLPDARTPEFAAQVAHAIAVLQAADAVMSPEERAEWDAWEALAFEDLPEWTGPDLSKPDTT
jgi:hypothetical protein